MIINCLFVDHPFPFIDDHIHCWLKIHCSNYKMWFLCFFKSHLCELFTKIKIRVPGIEWNWFGIGHLSPYYDRECTIHCFINCGCSAREALMGSDHILDYTDWWFGTCFIFPYIGNNHPQLTTYFSERSKPPTSQVSELLYIIYPDPSMETHHELRPEVFWFSQGSTATQCRVATLSGTLKLCRVWWYRRSKMSFSQQQNGS